MSTKRTDKRERTSVAETKATKTTTRTTATEIDVLTPMEEKTFRMRHGVTLEREAELTMVDELPGIPPEVAAQIRAIERRALEMQGQLRPISAKAKIISSLKAKRGDD